MASLQESRQGCASSDFGKTDQQPFENRIYLVIQFEGKYVFVAKIRFTYRAECAISLDMVKEGAFNNISIFVV